jgi:hypothetical protein
MRKIAKLKQQNLNVLIIFIFSVGNLYGQEQLKVTHIRANDVFTFSDSTYLWRKGKVGYNIPVIQNYNKIVEIYKLGVDSGLEDKSKFIAGCFKGVVKDKTPAPAAILTMLW